MLLPKHPPVLVTRHVSIVMNPSHSDYSLSPEQRVIIHGCLVTTTPLNEEKIDLIDSTPRIGTRGELHGSCCDEALLYNSIDEMATVSIGYKQAKADFFGICKEFWNAVFITENEDPTIIRPNYCPRF